MMSFNLVVFAGRAGTDPESRATNDGTPLASFRLAVNTYAGRDESGEAKEDTMWITVIAWQKLGETVTKFVKKGSPVLVSGELHIRNFTD